MEGDQQAGTHARTLGVAALFAILALVVLGVVWKWPSFFNITSDSVDGTSQLTAEEKTRVLHELAQSNADSPMSNEDKRTILEQAASSNEQMDVLLAEQQKFDILNSLKSR